MIDCPCQSGGSFRAAVRADVDRAVVHVGSAGQAFCQLTVLTVLRCFMFFPGLIGVLAYRLGHLLSTRAPWPLRSFAFLPTRLASHLVGVEIEPHVHAGPGLFVNHFGNVFVGAQSIGRNCNIAHGVTIGRSTTEESTGGAEVPTIGDRVWIGPNAVVVGGVTLHADSAVSANSLITRDVPAGAVVVGVPARVVAWRGSFVQVRYRGMDDDPERKAALAQMAEKSAARDRPSAG